MKPHDNGTLENSQIYFYSPSIIAKGLYFYPIYLGHYYCDKDYMVDRTRFDSFLMLYVKSGSGFAEIDGKHEILREGSIVLIDCYKPHRYYTNTYWEIYWVHFDGVMASKFYNLATKNGNVVTPANHYVATHELRKLVQMFEGKDKVNEAIFSRGINDLLTEFILCANESPYAESRTAVIDESIKFISENLDKDISLELLAKQASLSPFYFSRIFKKETDFTPHQYIIMIRIDYSRYLLRTSQMLVKEVAYRCGFNSESSFCTCFHKIIGITPNCYRDSE
ncbi:MAG: AraC family transcriptional regulator [Ruthenibacterium sp.]